MKDLFLVRYSPLLYTLSLVKYILYLMRESRFVLFSFSLLGYLVFYGCAETNLDAVSYDSKTTETSQDNMELSRRLDQVGTLEVAQCLVLVEVTVATVGNSAKLISGLGKMGRGLAAIDNAVTLTMTGWISAAGVESSAASGVSWILIKTAELAGLPTAGDFAKSTILILINTALKLAESCLLVAQTYWEGIKSLPYVFGYEPEVNGCIDYDGWIECQRVCGVSINQQEQIRLWSIPNQCQFEPMQSNIRQAYINGYLRFCLESMCRQGNVVPSSFNSCTWQGNQEERELMTDWPPLEERCQDAREVASYLEEDTTTAPPVSTPSNQPNDTVTEPPNMNQMTPSTINSCTELFTCEQSCVQNNQGQLCTNDCYERVSNTEIISLLNQLYTCASNYQCADVTCLEESCESQYVACGFQISGINNQNNTEQGGEDNVPNDNQSGGSDDMIGGSGDGTLTCEQAWNCLIDCQDQACADTCINLGTMQAQQDVLTLLNCYSINESFITSYEELYNYCPDESFTCFN